MLAPIGSTALRTLIDLNEGAATWVNRHLFDGLHFDDPAAETAARAASADDLAYVLEFLRTALEFGALPPFVQYLRWLDSTPEKRSVLADKVADTLLWLGEFYRVNIAGADGETVQSTLQEARAALLNPDANATVIAPVPEGPQAAAFRTAILAGQQCEALGIMNAALDGGMDLTAFEAQVIQPALYAIGELWNRNLVSVAQEHLATSIVHTVMSAGLLRSAQPALHGKKVLLACVEGNHHEIGLRMVADSFMLSGWSVQYLGANLPATDLLAQAKAWRPDLVGLSVALSSQMAAARHAIALLRSALPPGKPAVMVGGLAINSCTPNARASGADAHFADALSVLEGAEAIMKEVLAQHS